MLKVWTGSSAAGAGRKSASRKRRCPPLTVWLNSSRNSPRTAAAATKKSAGRDGNGSPHRESRRKYKLRADARIRRLSRSASNLKKEAARCRRALALVRRELARRRKIESTLRETISELEAFSYSMSHDMRAPLRTMRSFSQILIHDYASQIDAVGLDHLNRIARAAARLDLLIEDVLNYSRTAREKLDRSRIDLAPLIQEIISERPNLSVHARCIHIPGSLQPVLAHRAALTQCITNLLENAIKFVKPGRAPNIKIFTRKTPGRVLLCIQDFGIGIPRDAQKRIFGLFQGLRHAPDFMSAGVGLTIVRKITERMGGRCGVKSQRGKGSLFWIDLPAGG